MERKEKQEMRGEPFWKKRFPPGPPSKNFSALLLAVLSMAAAAANAGEAKMGKLAVEVREAGKTAPLPCRVHLSAGGKAIYAPDCPRWERDAGFCCDGRFEVDVPAGKIELRIERGLEWKPHVETFEIAAGKTREVKVSLSHWLDMNKLGWWSGDLHVHRPPKDMSLLMRAEDLNVAPVLTHWNQRHLPVGKPYLIGVRDRGGKMPWRFYHTLNQEDERIGGAILIFNMTQPILRKGVYRHWPSGMVYHRAALEQKGAHIEQEKPFWWEAPVNVALGRIDSMGIVHNHFNRRGLMENEAWGRARDREKYPGPLGFCLYTLDLWYRYLNLGWNIPASAGSASGVLANPVGYNRVYVRLPVLDYEGWFEGLRAGRNFATNGPVILATVNERPVGTHFEIEAGKRFNAHVRFEAASRAPLDRAEVIVDGKVVATYKPSPERLAHIGAEYHFSLDKSAWIAVRAFERHKPTLRFAHTSPFYVTVGGEKRRDPDAARFYVKWIDDLIARMEKDRKQFRIEEHFNEVIETYKQARAKYEGMTEE